MGDLAWTIHPRVYLTAFTTLLMNVNPFGVPRPVTLSQPGPVAKEESVPKVNTSQRVDDELWNICAYKSLSWAVEVLLALPALSKTGGFGGLKNCACHV